MKGKGKGKGKKMKGGFIKSRSTKTTFDPLNILLLGLLAYLVYHMMNNIGGEKPHVIYKEIIKEVPLVQDLDDQPYREDIYKPDRRQARSFPPFNIKTRGPPEEYDMVGFLQDTDDSNKLQQLYGRRTYPNSNLWNYFVKSDQYHQIPIPVSIGGQNCTDERGCKELNDKESLNILNKDHTATIYKPEPYYYNPYVL